MNIYPYNEKEFQEAKKKLARDKDFIKYLLNKKSPKLYGIIDKFPFFYSIASWKLDKKFKNINNTEDLQILLKKEWDNQWKNRLKISGIDNLLSDKPKLIVAMHSNVEDAQNIMYALKKIEKEIKQKTPYSAVGSNLVRHEWYKHLMKMNKVYVVDRSNDSPFNINSFYTELTKHLIEKKDNFLLESREGTSGNNILDICEVCPKIIKFLAINAKKNYGMNVKNLCEEVDIIPVSLNYDDAFGVFNSIRAYRQYNEGVNLKGFSDVERIHMENETKRRGHIHFCEKIDAINSRDLAGKIYDSIIQNFPVYPINQLCYDISRLKDVKMDELPRLLLDNDAEILIKDFKRKFKKWNMIYGDDIDKKVFPYFIKIHAGPLIKKYDRSQISNANS